MSFNSVVFFGANRLADAGFRGLLQDLEGFLSAEREKARRDAPFGRARGRGKKENFSARRKITFMTQKGGSYLSRCRNDPEKTAMISLTSRTTRSTKCGCEFSHSVFFLSIVFSLYLISDVRFFFSLYIKNNYAEKILPYAAA